MTQLTGFKSDHIGSYIVKDPESTLDYSINWEDWLDTGDTITGSNWTIETIAGDTDPVLRTTDGFVGTGLTTIWVSGGTAGNNYRITNTITTDNGLTDERYFRVFVKDRSA
jgi:hypothetical protein